MALLKAFWFFSKPIAADFLLLLVASSFTFWLFKWLNILHGFSRMIDCYKMIFLNRLLIWGLCSEEIFSVKKTKQNWN